MTRKLQITVILLDRSPQPMVMRRTFSLYITGQFAWYVSYQVGSQLSRLNTTSRAFSVSACAQGPL
jgi:hypothetical protein